MEFEIKQWKIQDLISLYEGDDLDLSPPYQRGDIWSLPAKKRLIDTIKLGFPLPSFFLYEKTQGKFEMVDGQQRTRTILGYVKGFFPDLEGEKFDDSNKHVFLNEYKLAVITMKNVLEHEAIEEFYYRVNRFGTKLNRPEILKAQYYGTPVQELIERIAVSEGFEALNLFTDTTKSRMNDLDFIGELLTLLKYGITDKKIQVDKFYADSNFSDHDVKEIEDEFQRLLENFIRFNSISPLKETRYKQRNDFYTFWGFIKEHANVLPQTLDAFYRIMVLVDPDISPSNDECFSLQEYAINCVSQSNSKKAREARLSFFDNLLLNTDPNPLAKMGQEGENQILTDVMKYYGIDDSKLMQIETYYTLNETVLKELRREI